ncbi:hypothetical protein V8C26DRAFT_401298 [Trichoderma gracile]
MTIIKLCLTLLLLSVTNRPSMTWLCNLDNPTVAHRSTCTLSGMSIIKLNAKLLRKGVNCTYLPLLDVFDGALMKSIL